MSNKVFQDIIVQMSQATSRAMGVLDEEGTVIASSTDDMPFNDIFPVISDFSDTAEIIEKAGFACYPIFSGSVVELVVFVEGTDELASRFVSMAAVAVANAKQFHNEKYGKALFVKNVLLDNVLPGDINIRAREIRLSTDILRAVLIIRLVDNSEVAIYEVIQSLFPEKQRDFVININETDIALVKEVHSTTTQKDLQKLARSIVDTLNGEFFTKAFVGIGSIVPTVAEINRSFKEAQVALEVGRIFESEKSITCYDNLGIGRLIYQLPTTLCEIFLNEIFKKSSIDAIDYETLFTIQKFFENNLNVSETARKLFVHRNTLVYRIEKVRRMTGLDLREFEDAIVFKVALLVKKYLTASGYGYSTKTKGRSKK